MSKPEEIGAPEAPERQQGSDNTAVADTLLPTAAEFHAFQGQPQAPGDIDHDGGLEVPTMPELQANKIKLPDGSERTVAYDQSGKPTSIKETLPGSQDSRTFTQQENGTWAMSITVNGETKEAKLSELSLSQDGKTLAYTVTAADGKETLRRVTETPDGATVAFPDGQTATMMANGDEIWSSEKGTLHKRADGSFELNSPDSEGKSGKLVVAADGKMTATFPDGFQKEYAEPATAQEISDLRSAMGGYVDWKRDTPDAQAKHADDGHHFNLMLSLDEARTAELTKNPPKLAVTPNNKKDN